MKISVYLASSVNGMISNARGVADWLSQEYGRGFYSMCEQARAVIMGKTTYQILAPDHLPLKDDGTVIVLTRDTSAQPAQPNVVFTDRSARDIVGMLEARGHGEAVIVGGALTVSEFIRSGLVDELYLVIEPVLFGGGLPMLKDVDAELRLDLLDVDRLNDDTVQLHYRVLRA